MTWFPKQTPSLFTAGFIRTSTFPTHHTRATRLKMHSIFCPFGHITERSLSPPTVHTVSKIGPAGLIACSQNGTMPKPARDQQQPES
mmetsp:Transcript_34235/g.78962  ORF Transcript_34235/g.78962 Transcript_34235/m.78962 type:complete len:87 (-) Transcript_34235:1378-1638(-)